MGLGRDREASSPVMSPGDCGPNLRRSSPSPRRMRKAIDVVRGSKALTDTRCGVAQVRPEAGPLLRDIREHRLVSDPMAVSETREHLAEVIDSAQRTGEPVYLTRRGRAVAVVVDPVVFEKLLDDAEDALDRAELALAGDEDDYIPWEQVKADLGLS